MSLHLHREDIKAGLRKRFGSVTAFERQRALPAKSVSDVLRGRSVAATAQAIADELGMDVSKVAAPRAKRRTKQSDKADNSTPAQAHHRLSAGAR